MQEIQSILDHFTESFHSLIISSMTKEGTPYVSYAPFVTYDDTYYILISQMAKHYHNLVEHHHASIMFIEDESKAQSIFFRKRLSYEVIAHLEEKDEQVVEAMKQRHGHMVDQLLTLDFRIMRMEIKKGLLVLGAGRAYVVDDQGHIVDQAGRGQGHQR